jgi:hypothetical protein
MDNIFTHEEAAAFVTYNDLTIVLEETLKMISEEIIKADNITFDGLNNLVNILADRINDIEYKRIRDMYFILGRLAYQSHCTTYDMRKTYENYCDEFDRLNKKE